MEYKIFLIRRKNEVMKRLLTLLFLAFTFAGHSQTVLKFERSYFEIDDRSYY
jgi:hypothetical protein